MPRTLTNCTTCQHCNLKAQLCDADMWDRNADDETWLHSDDDFNEYINKDRFCTERINIVSI
jgi:hypothetical protein